MTIPPHSLPSWVPYCARNAYALAHYGEAFSDHLEKEKYIRLFTEPKLSELWLHLSESIVSTEQWSNLTGAIVHAAALIPPGGESNSG